MERASVDGAAPVWAGRLKAEPYFDADGGIRLPDDLSLSQLLDHNIDEFGDDLAYRYIDYSHDPDGTPIDMTWSQVGVRSQAIGARLQQVTTRGDRVAILCPQGLDYVTCFFAAIQAGNIAVPLFAPELPGHAERLDAVLTDALPAAVLTTTSASEAVQKFVRLMPRETRPRIIAVDAIPDSVGATFAPSKLDTDDIAYLQYTSGSTRAPAGVEISHRAAGTNFLQMVHAIGLEGDWDINGASWLPMYHDMGLIMVVFPVLYAGHLTFMSPMAFVRRPGRWIQMLHAASRSCRIVSPAPNFAFELVAQRGLPKNDEVDLSNVILINGSEPVSLDSITKFTEAFLPYGLSKTAVRPSYGMAEATLFVSSVRPETEPTAIYLDREQLGKGRAVRVEPDAPTALAQVSCGHVSVSQWAAIVDPETGEELPDECVGEIWLHGNNIGRGYWARPEETEHTFGNKLQSRLESGTHADGADDDATWLRTGDLGVYIDGELYITGRIKDMVIVDGRNYYPQDIEATVAESSHAIRAGFVAAFSVPARELPNGSPTDTSEKLIIVAERGPGAGRADPQPIADAVRRAVSRKHVVNVYDVRLVAAGVIPRTTSGKLARRACRAEYLDGTLGTR
ncbi:fatty acyl-AMP ligase [Mycobacterium sp. 1274761.0]|uniref:fatty acyl-AMP ligase n=1 Tax=Mycobacterium sp. 1274761.0 TaxID=1834077 RepID=UPI0007FC5ABE|nr:fatty acyl-AMP ligase [Mycobacterium sp. 1274761.0]OBK70949.1 fatty-acid--CoA ligase [Mycobacterium sp. 1274761.0]